MAAFLWSLFAIILLLAALGWAIENPMWVVAGVIGLVAFGAVNNGLARLRRGRPY